MAGRGAAALISADPHPGLPPPAELAQPSPAQPGTPTESLGGAAARERYGWRRSRSLTALRFRWQSRPVVGPDKDQVLAALGGPRSPDDTTRVLGAVQGGHRRQGSGSRLRVMSRLPWEPKPRPQQGETWVWTPVAQTSSGSRDWG